MKGGILRWAALAVGIVLFAGALYYINLHAALEIVQRLGLALPLALLVSGLWHLARTWAWAWCFPQPRRVGFLRLARVRLAAEAFSYLTLRGIAGEPLKVVLLTDRVDAREATAAVALERLAYLVGTILIVGIASIAAMVSLPLTRIWFRVFRAFAIVAAIVGVLTVLIIRGRGTYLQSFIRHMDAQFGTSMTARRVTRFAVAVEAQILELVRGNPARLAVLVIATVLSYLLMALEAWVILRASGAPITANGALAVETFSRVASFASAFIPANLGALEASSLAAVAAAGLVSGGAALAVARRLRGLFWAGVGLAIYPRGTRRARVSDDTTSPRRTPPRATFLYLPYDRSLDVPPTTRLAGLPIFERAIRAAIRAGYTRIVVWIGDAPHEVASRLRELVPSIEGLIVVDSDEEWRQAVAGATAEIVTAVGPGTVVSPALLASARGLVPDAGQPCDVPAGPAWLESGVLRLYAADAPDPSVLAREFARRRHRAAPLPSGENVSSGRAKLALRIERSSDLRRAEATIRRSSYKDTDNTLARFNRRVSLPISVALIRTPLTANQLSILLVIVGFYSAWLFSMGRYAAGVLAGCLSLAASVLDGCDGEIARLKYQESALGCWIETFGDYSYYLAIFVGLAIGAVRQTHAEAFYWLGGLALAGTLISFALLIYLRSRITAGQPERLHAIAGERFQAEPSFWSRLVWRVSFTATRSAMPYGILAFALVNGLPMIVVLAAIGANVYWISLAVKLRALVGEEAVAA